MRGELPELLEALRSCWNSSYVVRTDQDELIINKGTEDAIQAIVYVLNERVRELEERRNRVGLKLGRKRVPCPSKAELEKMLARSNKKGKQVSLASVAKDIGISRQTLRNRLNEI